MLIDLSDVLAKAWIPIIPIFFLEKDSSLTKFVHTWKAKVPDINNHVNVVIYNAMLVVGKSIRFCCF